MEQKGHQALLDGFLVPSRYEIYVGHSSDPNPPNTWAQLTDQYMFEDIEAGRSYYFWLRTINRDGASQFTPCKSIPYMCRHRTLPIVRLRRRWIR